MLPEPHPPNAVFATRYARLGIGLKWQFLVLYSEKWAETEG